MKKIILYFLALLGSVFLIILIGLTYFYITDPFNLKPLIFGTEFKIESAIDLKKESTEKTESAAVPAMVLDETVNTVVEDVKSTDVVSTTKAAVSDFTLSQAQKDALLNLGIPPEAVPTVISAEQEQCFIQVLGEERVKEIKAGAIPGTFEFIKAQSCI
jgi:hypothetical protein